MKSDKAFMWMMSVDFEDVLPPELRQIVQYRNHENAEILRTMASQESEYQTKGKVRRAFRSVENLD
jgi:hypothetical protein